MKILLAVLLLAASASSQSPVTYERILGAAGEAQNWLTYSGRYSGWRYSTLNQINTSSASHLAMQWAFQVGDLGQFETTPIVVDGVLFGTGQNDRAFALDARTGRAIWRYQRNLPEKLQPCCGMVNRGVAVLGERVFMATLDAHVIALDRKTGNLLWDVTSADYHQAYTFTVAPLALKNEVIVGTSGGEYGVRGFIDAYDAATGRRLWRFETVPGPGQPGHETWAGDSWKTGGAPAWMTGTYDPDLNLVYWPTGNPSPSNYGGERGGDNLYSNCMLALDADTGKLKWYFQFTPHDLYDYDATQIPVLVDADWEGRPRKLLIQANRNGFFYVLDRVNGQVLMAKPFIKRLTWAGGVGPDGRPRLLQEGEVSCPEAATNWNATAFSQVTHLYYVMALEKCVVQISPGSWKRESRQEERGMKYLRAIDIETGKIIWEKPQIGPSEGKRNPGVLVTAGGLLFHGDPSGDFVALDERDGKTLWHFPANGENKASPMTYMVDGKQLIAIAIGPNIICFGLP